MANSASATQPPFTGPAYLLEGFRRLRLPRLRRYVLMPVVGNVVIFLLAAVCLFFGLDFLLDRWLPEGFDWLRYLLFPLVAAAMLAVGMLAFTLLAALLLSPFLGRLAAEVDQMEGISPPDQPPAGWLAGLRADLGLELRRLAYIATCLLGVLLLGLTPLLNLLVAPVGVLVSSWLLAVEYAGNPLGNHRQSLREQLTLLRSARWTVVGFGLASFGCSLVPIVNFVVVPASVIGITLMCADLRARAHLQP
jgi:CysZ protein